MHKPRSPCGGRARGSQILAYKIDKRPPGGALVPKPHRIFQEGFSTQFFSQLQTEIHGEFGVPYLRPRSTCAFLMHTVMFHSPSSAKQCKNCLPGTNGSGYTAEKILPISVTLSITISTDNNYAPARSAGLINTSFFTKF